MSKIIKPMSLNLKSAVCNFWFGKIGDPDYLRPKSFWYGSEQDDILVREKLGNAYEDAKAGKLSDWSDDVEGSLALILLLDQVPRNIFRDKPEAYATDDKALSVAKNVVAKKWDKDQPTTIRRYLYSPFNHSENIKDQEESLRLFKELGDPTHLYWATNFYETVKAHGRFPHRDKILGRK